MPLPSRRIANRDRRETRIGGCTWSEWAVIAGPLLVVVTVAPWLFALVFAALWVGLVLGIGRSFQPGALRGHSRHYTAILRHGTRATRIALADPSLRDGFPFLAPRGPRPRSAGLMMLALVGASGVVVYLCLFT